MSAGRYEILITALRSSQPQQIKFYFERGALSNFDNGLAFKSNSSQTQKIEFDFVHALLPWFLVENWVLVKLKSNSKY